MYVIQYLNHVENMMLLLPDGPLGWLCAGAGAALLYLLSDSCGLAEDEPPAEQLDGATCRVCYAGSEAGRLFTPCRCTGTMRYVHVECLNSWRSASVNPRSFFSCDQCGYAYRTRRTKIAQLLQDEKVVWIFSCALLALFIGVASMVPGVSLPTLTM